jgi:hypothetical protein
MLLHRQFRLSSLLAVVTAVCLLGALWQWPATRVFVYAGAGFAALSTAHLMFMIVLFRLLERYVYPLVVRNSVPAPLESRHVNRAG